MALKNKINLAKDLSMHPLILPTDKVIVSEAKAVKVNDIVVFEKEAKLIAHRVIFIPQKDAFITRGDNNKSSDGLIHKENLLGKVEKIVRNGEEISIDHIYYSQSSAYLDEVHKLSSMLLTKKIPYLILKGLPVHLYINKKPPKRLYLDIDILIRKKDLKNIHSTLIDGQYNISKNVLFGKEVKGSTQLTYVKEKKPFPVVVDIHLEPAVGFTRAHKLNALLPDLRKLTNYLFKSINSVSIDGATYPLLDDRSLFLYLLLHFFHHNLQGAHRGRLINDLFKKKIISIDSLAKDIDYLEMENIVYLSLFALNKHFQLDMSDKELNKIKVSKSIKFLSSMVSKFIDPFSEGSRYTEAFKRLLLVFMFSQKPLVKRVTDLARLS